MVLNFGRGGLFGTSYEERWKGVYERRISEIPTAKSENGNYAAVPQALTYLDVSVDMGVKPDEKVVCIVSAVGEQEDSGDTIVLRLKRGATEIALAPYIDNTNDVELITAGLSINTVDDPGEGIHTYTVWGSSSHGTAHMRKIMLTCFIITVK